MPSPYLRPLVRGFSCAIAVAMLATACTEPTNPGSGEVLKLEVAHSFPSLAANDFITTFDFAPDGTLWVVSFQGDIIRVRQGQTTKYDAEAILGPPLIPEAAHVWDLFIDGAGRPWVTGAKAVAVFDDGTWKRQDPPDYMGLSAKAGQIAVNAAGDVLLAAGDVIAGGLLLRRGGTWQVITPANSQLRSPLTLEIEVAPDGSFWVAAAQFQGEGGLSRITAGNVTAVFDVARTGLLYNWIDDIAIGGGRIWLGFAVPIYDRLAFPDGGMQSLALGGGQPETQFPFESGLGSNRVRSLTWSSTGEVWFTTGLDEDSGCQTCISSIGVLDAEGRFDVISHINSTIAPNEFLPEIQSGPDGAIYVARGDLNQIVKVFR